MTFQIVEPILSFDGPYRFLSNFYPAPIKWRGLEWTTSEHAYQASKTSNKLLQQFISTLPTPNDAKQVGKALRLPSNWDEIKFTYMRSVVKAKFTQNPKLLEALIETYPAHLEEGNWWKDTCWGVCPVGSGNGENHLGKILMELRLHYCTENAFGY